MIAWKVQWGMICGWNTSTWFEKIFSSFRERRFSSQSIYFHRMNLEHRCCDEDILNLSDIFLVICLCKVCVRVFSWGSIDLRAASGSKRWNAIFSAILIILWIIVSYQHRVAWLQIGLRNKWMDTGDESKLDHDMPTGKINRISSNYYHHHNLNPLFTTSLVTIIIPTYIRLIWTSSSSSSSSFSSLFPLAANSIISRHHYSSLKYNNHHHLSPSPPCQASLERSNWR